MTDMLSSLYIFYLFFYSQHLQEAFERCLIVLSEFSKPEELPVQIVSHISKCYAVSAQFEGCREKITEMPEIVNRLCNILRYKV